MSTQLVEQPTDNKNMKWLSIYQLVLPLLSVLLVGLGVLALALIGFSQVPSNSQTAEWFKAIGLAAIFVCAIICVLGARALRIVESNSQL